MLENGSSLTVGSHQVTVIRYLSEGGFSKIYEVHMEGDEAKVACLKQVLVRDKAGLATLRKEVDVMKTLRKARSIVRYYDSNAETLPDGTIQVLVLMELCPNNSLLHYMNDRIRLKLSEPEILKIMIDISVGIYEMHKLNLVHRDIKIENVLIDAKNRFKLCDFGSVSTPIRPPKDQQEFQMLSHDILYQTTPQYRAPEMIDLYRGLPIDERSDIWALGCFLYKLCYYTTPFEASGDIAILHASFQFLPAPIYSGDLKNLIIIMLQENPRYRPNIVQIIMLLAKMLQTDFESLHVEDFYHAGPYDFQALHEMQKEKQNEQLKRQQYYYEQQLQQQKFESQQKQPSSRESQPLHEHIPGQNTAHSAKSSNPEIEAVEGRKSLDIKRTASRPDSVKSGTTSSSVENTALQGVAPDTKRPVSMEEVLDSPEIDGFTEDFPDLENVAERYPSLDVIDQAVSSGSRGSSVPQPGKQATQNLDIANGIKPSALSKTTLHSELENVEAWQKLPHKPIDKDAEKLVEDIFVQGPSEITSLRSDLYHNKSMASESSKGSEEREKLVSAPSSADRSPELWKKEPAKNPVEVSVPKADVSRYKENKANEPVYDYFAHEKDNSIAPQKNMKHSLPGTSSVNAINNVQEAGFYQAGQHVLSQDPQNYLLVKPEMRRETSNPWGSALESKPLPVPMDLSAQVANLNLQEAQPKRAETKDLIDFDSAEIQTHSAVPLANALPNSLPDNDVSLLDLDEDSVRRNSDGKPKFKKKLGAMQPLQFEFQEQVIDFASDDENNNSQMSRVSIRNSLKKSRKSSDHHHHRRSDSAHGEGKKRMSFFGNTD